MKTQQKALKPKEQRQAEHIWTYYMRGHNLLTSLGLINELDTTKAMALFILANPGTHLEAIKRDEYFRSKSSSTLKRASLFLYKNGYVKQTQCPDDARRKLLYFKQVA